MNFNNQENQEFDLFFYSHHTMNVDHYIHFLYQNGIKTFATTSLTRDLLIYQKKSKILFYHVDGSLITFLHICYFMGMGKFIVLFFDKNYINSDDHDLVDKIIYLMSIPYTNTKNYLSLDNALYYIIRKWKKKEFVFKKDKFNYKMKIISPDTLIDCKNKLLEIFFYLGQCHLKNEKAHLMNKIVFQENFQNTQLLINDFNF